MSDRWIATALIVATLMLLGAFFLRIESKYTAACTETGGTAVFNGRHWECMHIPTEVPSERPTTA